MSTAARVVWLAAACAGRSGEVVAAVFAGRLAFLSVSSACGADPRLPVCHEPDQTEDNVDKDPEEDDQSDADSCTNRSRGLAQLKLVRWNVVTVARSAVGAADDPDHKNDLDDENKPGELAPIFHGSSL